MLKESRVARGACVLVKYVSVCCLGQSRMTAVPASAVPEKTYGVRKYVPTWYDNLTGDRFTT